MPLLKTLPTFKDERGSLTVIEKDLGFKIERLFYIYDVSAVRGGHGHRRTQMALIALNGTVEVSGQTPKDDFSFALTKPDQALILAPEDWHEMSFSKGSVLLALASEPYSKDDYFYDKYRR